MTPAFRCKANRRARMAELGVVQMRRDGVRIFYRIVDPCNPTLLDSGLCLARAIEGGKAELVVKTEPSEISSSS